MGRLARRFRTVWGALAVGASILAAACTSSGMRGPFGADEVERGMAAYHVRFHVACDRCLIRWSVGFESGQERSTDSWSHGVQLTLSADETTMARLVATPTPDGDPVDGVAISVNGRVVARGGSSSPAGMPGGVGESILVETEIPPPGGKPIIAGGGGRR